MIDEAELLTRQAAYVDTVRALGRRERTIGLVACLVGVIVLVVSRYRVGAPMWGVWLGVAIIGVGWALFLYDVIRRARFLRAYPFDATRFDG